MSDSVSDGLNAAANLAKAVPIYDDALKPLAIETGKALGTAGRVVNACLAPIRGAVWGAEKIEDWLNEKVASKLEGTPEEKIVSPDLIIAGPTIEALKFRGANGELSEMFANLLASSMTKGERELSHPSFVEKIKMLNSLDARLFAFISKEVNVPTLEVLVKYGGRPGHSRVFKCLNSDLFEVLRETHSEFSRPAELILASIENLSGLGLITYSAELWLTSENAQKKYEAMKEHPLIKTLYDNFPTGPQFDNSVKSYGKSMIQITQVGKDFARVVFR